MTAHPSSGPAAPRAAWRSVGLVLFAVGWGANHFAALLPIYRRELRLDAAAPALLFGVYALGLMPGLLLAGALSDRLGRRRLVRAGALGALVSSALLSLSAHSFFALAAGRFCYGLSAGAAMTPGAVWVVELSRGEGSGQGARRATVSLSSGFGLGPLASGLLAQLAPWPTQLPFAVHLGLLGVALALGWGTEDGGPPAARQGPLLHLALGKAEWRRFWAEVFPVTLFVFTFPTLAFTTLPLLLPSVTAGAPSVMAGVLSAVTLGSGVLAQPFALRFTPLAGARAGLGIGAAGVGAAMAALGFDSPWGLLAAAPLLGVAYGLTVTSGLRGVEAIAPPTSRGGLTGVFYVLIYVGFASPFLVAQGAALVGALPILATLAGSALVARAWLGVEARRASPPS